MEVGHWGQAQCQALGLECDLILLPPPDRGDKYEVKEEGMSVQPDSPILFDIPEGIPTDIDFLERLGQPSTDLSRTRPLANRQK